MNKSDKMSSNSNGFKEYGSPSVPMESGKAKPNNQSPAQRVDRNMDPGNAGKMKRRAYGIGSNPETGV